MPEQAPLEYRETTTAAILHPRRPGAPRRRDAGQRDRRDDAGPMTQISRGCAASTYRKLGHLRAIGIVPEPSSPRAAIRERPPRRRRTASGFSRGHHDARPVLSRCRSCSWGRQAVLAGAAVLQLLRSELYYARYDVQDREAPLQQLLEQDAMRSRQSGRQVPWPGHHRFCFHWQRNGEMPTDALRIGRRSAGAFRLVHGCYCFTKLSR